MPSSRTWGTSRSCCGPDPAPQVEVPSWAKVAPEQIAEAAKHGVPVAFENDLGMRFVLIPAGTFLMGSPEDEGGRQDDEVQQDVTISKPLYVQVTEVTNGQYRQIRPEHDSGDTGLWPEAEHGDEALRSLNADDQPVANLSWNDAVAFAETLMARNPRRRYRLPTEPEWEYACRAGTTTKFWWGSDPRECWRFANGWYPHAVEERWRNDAWWPAKDDGHRVTAPAGSYRPNPWGLHDMAGNVWEWCQNMYRSGTHRVIRGGYWESTSQLLRSAHRGHVGPQTANCGIGFRLVSPLPEPSDR